MATDNNNQAPAPYQTEPMPTDNLPLSPTMPLEHSVLLADGKLLTAGMACSGSPAT